jgi:mercuric ion transport protein
MKTGSLTSNRYAFSLSGFAVLLSTGTLLCCALPIILVSVGLGAAVVALTSQFPVLITLSGYKLQMFTGAAVLLVISAWLIWRPGTICPVDLKQAALCEKLQLWSKRLFILATGIWSVGFFFAYLSLPIRIWLES